MTHAAQLIIGMGEVGRGLHAVLPEAHTLDLYSDSDTASVVDRADVLHICFPYSKDFVLWVKAYAKQFKPSLIVIHSTVKIGTTEKIPNAVHSPIRGKHPDLAEGIRTFVKYFGGARAEEAADLFPDLRCVCWGDARLTEALKLWDTTQYGWMIALEKEMYRWCGEHFAAPAEAMAAIYGDANLSYNEGYGLLGNPRVQRPALKHAFGPIGGHCVMPNLDLLGGKVPSVIKKLSEGWK